MAIFTYDQVLKKSGVKSADVKSMGVPGTPPAVPEKSSSLFNLQSAKDVFAKAGDDVALAQQNQRDNGNSLPSTLKTGATMLLQGGLAIPRALGAGVFGTDKAKEITGNVIDTMTKVGEAITPDSIERYVGEKAMQVVEGYDAMSPQEQLNQRNKLAVAEVLSYFLGGQGGKGAATPAVRDVVETTIDAVPKAPSSPGTLSKVIRGAGSTLYKTAITPNVEEAKQIIRYRANSPFLTRVSEFDVNAPRTRSQTALEYNIAGTESMMGVQARKAADTLWKNKIEPLVKNSDVQMTKDELFTTALERISAIEDPTRKKAMMNAYEALLDDYAKYPDSFDLTKAQALKRDLAKFTPTKIFKGQEVANEMRMLQADMASAIRKKTYDSFPDENIKKMYLDWANLDELEGLGIKAISEASFKGGSGTLLSGLWDMATTPVKTVGGLVLYRVGNAFEFKAPKTMKFKTFGEYLRSLGYSRPVVPPVNPNQVNEEPL